MKNPFGIFFRARNKLGDAVSAAATFPFGIAGSGKSVNGRTAIQAYGMNYDTRYFEKSYLPSLHFGRIIISVR